MIKIDVTGIKEAQRAIEQDAKKAVIAMQYALNDAAKSARVEASSAIRERFNLPKARVDKEVRTLKMATRIDLTAIIQAAGRPIGLLNYGAKQIKNIGGRAVTTTKSKSMLGKRAAKNSGVYVQIEKGRTTRLPNAFIAAGRRGKEAGGALQVFSRKGNTLINRATVTIATMMAQQRVIQRVTKKINEQVAKRFSYHWDRLTK